MGATRTLDDLTREFSDLRIPHSAPGFYDHPRFAEVEQKQSAFLERHAEYVDLRPLTDEYVARVRSVVPRAAAFLYHKLVEDGRLGACIDANLILTRFLKKERVWNYLAAGCLTIEYPPGTGISRRFWRHFTPPEQKVGAGHAWICAPPYQVVDITLSRQAGVPERELTLLPEYLLAEQSQRGSVKFDIHDLMEPECWRPLGRPPSLDELYRHSPGVHRVIQRFEPLVVELPTGPKLKYVTCRLSAPDLPFEKMGTFCYSGKPPAELFREYESAESGA